MATPVGAQLVVAVLSNCSIVLEETSMRAAIVDAVKELPRVASKARVVTKEVVLVEGHDHGVGGRQSRRDVVVVEGRRDVILRMGRSAVLRSSKSLVIIAVDQRDVVLMGVVVLDMIAEGLLEGRDFFFERVNVVLSLKEGVVESLDVDGAAAGDGRLMVEGGSRGDGIGDGGRRARGGAVHRVGTVRGKGAVHEEVAVRGKRSVRRGRLGRGEVLEGQRRVVVFFLREAVVIAVALAVAVAATEEGFEGGASRGVDGVRAVARSRTRRGRGRSRRGRGRAHGSVES